DMGLSAFFVANADREARYVYFSSSITDILGYDPSELIGKSAYMIFHPDEIPFLREIHYRTVTEQSAACVAYMRQLHRDGYFVECCCHSSFVYGLSVGVVTRAEDGPKTIQQALTAQEVIEVSPSSQGRFSVRRLTNQHTARTSPQSTTLAPAPPESEWVLPPPRPRSFFLLDRFTDTARVMYVSNEVIVNANSLKNQPFYSIVRPSDRQLVQQYIEAAKAWSPVVQSGERSGGYGYCSFSVLKIPDLPPQGEQMPQGTDETERSMPGQGFIPVEGIFTACSDGLICMIDRK
ncbi:hypothetical protein BCR39DRAFT_467560, partial [Naematelia encephala]